MTQFDAAHATLPAVIVRNEKTVRDSFWPKLKRVLAQVPFAEQAVAAWYCAFDPLTPVQVKGVLLAALAYFVLPFDLMPDVVVGLGFTDDLTVLATAVGLVQAHIRPEHRDKARDTIARLRRGADVSRQSGAS